VPRALQHERLRRRSPLRAVVFVALCPLAVTACDESSVEGPRDGAAGPADGTEQVVDAFRTSDDASPGTRDATLDVTRGDDASVSSGEGGSDAGCASAAVPPSTLSCTGLYADIASKALALGVRSYEPAVPLWSDGAQKARWIQLPAGTQIDTSNPNEWTFPVGTKVWKEFSRNGRRIETRLFQKVDNGPPSYWVHATYAWNADETEASASNGGDITLEDGGTYHIPTFSECEDCHNGRMDHILGFEQVSLGLAGAQGLTLAELVSEGLVTSAPSSTALTIGDDGTGAAAAALAWIHINCGVTCHNGNPTATAYGAGMRLRLDPAVLDGRTLTASTVDTLRTTVGMPATTPGWIQPVAWTRIVPGDPDHSLLVQLISNRGTNNAVGAQMPPIATSIVDTADVAKVVDWVTKMASAPGADGGTDAGAMDAAGE
jgi:hypothetical protein